MKKRMIVLVLVAVMVSGLCVNAMAATRATRISPRLSFSGKTANCSVTVVEAGKLDVTLELWNGSKMVDSWSDTGTNYLSLSSQSPLCNGLTAIVLSMAPHQRPFLHKDMLLVLNLQLLYADSVQKL